MARAAVCTVLAACVVSLSGCATVLNCTDPHGGAGGEKRVYGGVLLDAAIAYKAVGGPAPSCSDWGLDRPAAWVGIWAALDLPLSAVADTLTLPFTVAAALQKDDPSKPTPPGTFTPDPDPAQQPARTAVSLPSPASPRREQQPGQ
jgi:uncharacterized protein YceK